jgi:hypothetical protein
MHNLVGSAARGAEVTGINIGRHPVGLCNVVPTKKIWNTVLNATNFLVLLSRSGQLRIQGIL